MRCPPAAVLPVLFALIALSVSCTLPSSEATPAARVIVPATPPVTTNLTSVPVNAIAVRLSSGSNIVSPNAFAQLTLTFEPVIVAVERRADGSVFSISQKHWENAPVALFRYCIGVNTPCPVVGAWHRFAASIQESVTVDWIGPRTVWAVAEFRDTTGRPIPGIDSNQDAGTQARAYTQLAGLIDSRTPDDLQPPSIQTLLAPTRAAFPVTGSVKIANSPCCAGGRVGTTVQLHVAFEAHSPLAQVAEMRIAFRCPRPGVEIETPWEPFVKSKTYTATVQLNFVGWDIAVQYRDALGNLSPVYCDDISIEGTP